MIDSVKHSCKDLMGNKIRAALAVLLYGSCSVSIVVINKMLMTSYDFDFPVFIMASQMAFTVILLEVLKILGYITLPAYSFDRAYDFALPSLFYSVNSVLALSALNHMNIALYGVMKRCVPVVTMVLSVLILQKGWPSRMTICSVFMLTIGCIIAGYGDLKFNLYGYVCGAISNLTQAVYLLLVQRSLNGKFSTVESLQLNSINTLPFLAILSVLNGEVSHVRQYTKYNDVSFFVIFVLTISLGCLLNYSLFLCTNLTSALTTSVVGGVKAIVQTAIGLFTFGGVSHNFSTFFGVSASICGGIGYIVAKYYDNQNRQSKSSVDIDKGHKPVSNGHLPNDHVEVPVKPYEELTIKMPDNEDRLP